MRIGDVEVGRLIEERRSDGLIHCRFEALPAFARYARAFSSDDIWEADDDDLDAVVDEISVDGVFLVSGDQVEYVDPDLRIDGGSARF